MRDLGVTDDTLIGWEFNDLRVTKIGGTISPVKIDAEVYADTKNFEVTDVSFRNPARKRMIGVKAALVRGHIGVRPTSFDIYDTHTDFGHSSIFVKMVSIAFEDAAVKMSVPEGAHIVYDTHNHAERVYELLRSAAAAGPRGVEVISQ